MHVKNFREVVCYDFYEDTFLSTQSSLKSDQSVEVSDALELLRSRLVDPRLSLELRECFLERFLSRDRERDRVFDLERLLFRREGDLLLERDRERLREYERPRDFERDLERGRHKCVKMHEKNTRKQIHLRQVVFCKFWGCGDRKQAKYSVWLILLKNIEKELKENDY